MTTGFQSTSRRLPLEPHCSLWDHDLGCCFVLPIHYKMMLTSECFTNLEAIGEKTKCNGASLLPYKFPGARLIKKKNSKGTQMGEKKLTLLKAVRLLNKKPVLVVGYIPVSCWSGEPKRPLKW